MQLSSQSCPNEIRDELFRLSKIVVAVAFADKFFRGNEPRCVLVNVLLSGSVTVGPVASCTSSRTSRSARRQ